MTLKVYTQAEFDAILPDEYGVRHFPTGDYRAIKKFGDLCEFEGFCVFGEERRFGEECVFGEECEFGDKCKFGVDSIFGIHCIFGGGSIFGGYCSFGNSCIFGEGCSFGVWSKFGEKYEFGADSTFENGFKSKTTTPFIILIGPGSEARTCYFYDFEKGIHVRAGCFFGTLEEFKLNILKCEKSPNTLSKKAKAFIAFCDSAAAFFN